LAFLTLRMDEHAQWEIRQYANAVGKLVMNYFPRTWSLFQLERQEAKEFQQWKKSRKA
jgi:thymidylate synthase ThyX